MYEIKHFYQNFIGNGEMQESQSKVNALQHKLSVLTEKRSSCEFELIDVKKQLAELNSSQQLVSREDAQYVELLWQEFKLNSEKQRLDSLLEVINNEHRMVLMQLTHAFNDVHAKERQEANKLRLVKLFFTTLVAVLRFLFFCRNQECIFVSHFSNDCRNMLSRQLVVACCTVQRLKQPAFGPNRIILIRCLTDRGKTTTAESITQEKGSQYQYYTIEPAEQMNKRGSHKQGTDIALRRISLIDLAKSKLYEAQSFYDEFSGMNEVKIAQNKVIEIQDQLQLVQERRRHILLELTLVRKQLQDIHIELQKATRGEHRYVELIKQEFDVLAREKEKNQIFQIIDQEERELFSHLTAAVKTSHEKERTQANNVKYWSIIASGVGALLGIVATSINYYFRNTQYEAIRKAAEESNRKLTVMEQKLVGLETSLGRMNVEWNRYLGEKRIAEQRRAIRSPVESWGGYIRRHLARFARVFIPKG
uniref:Coiled-coil domain-containing protein 51 n=1 Tax=Anopheles minimus TaxID=112268 RepID=A0A182VY74_9DIPT